MLIAFPSLKLFTLSPMRKRRINRWIGKNSLTLGDKKFGDTVKYTIPISAIYGLNI